jgi:hypothetical protein
MSRMTIHAIISMALAAPASAQIHATDVLLKVENGRVVTGRVEKGTPVYPRRAFSAEFGKLGIPNATTEPGFDSDEGAFDPGTIVGVGLRRALREWDGADFETIPDERMRLTKGAISILTPVADPGLCVVAGDLPLGLANGSGVLHQHPAYELLAPAEPGAYLLELEAWTNAPGGSASEPFWIVFNQNVAPAIVDDAVQYVEAVLGCPADYNRDGGLSIADFGAFQTGFVLGEARADFSGDCTLSVADFGAFQTAFVLGCP